MLYFRICILYRCKNLPAVISAEIKVINKVIVQVILYSYEELKYTHGFHVCEMFCHNMSFQNVDEKFLHFFLVCVLL